MVRGIDDEHAVEAIKQHVISCGHIFASGLEANHGGDAQGTGHDSGVRGLAADICGKSLREIPVQRGGLRGREIVSYENVRLGEVRKIMGAMAGEMFEHTAGHITNIGCAFAQVFIFYRAEGMRIFFGDLMKSISDVDLLGFDEALYLLQQRGIFQHQQVGIKDRRFGGTHAGLHFALNRRNLPSRFGQRVLEKLQFGGQLIGFQSLTGRPFALIVIHHHNPTADYAGRHTDTAKDSFASILCVTH